MACPLLHLLPAKPQVLRPETDIREDVRLEELVFRILEDQADLAPEVFHRIILCIDILAIEEDAAGGRPDQAV